MSWIKIDDRLFNCREISTQLSINSHVSIYVDFDLVSYPEYEKDLLRIYDSRNINITIETVKYIGYGCKMKTLDINFNKSLSITIDSQYMEIANIQERRDRNLEEVLNNKN